MRAWLLTISEKYPQHWDYAQQVGFWDMVSPRGIQAGDLVYFWQSGPKGTLLGKVRATEDRWLFDDPRVVPAGPWDDWPGGDKPYKARFALDVLASESEQHPTWTQVKEATGLRQTPSWVRTLTDSQRATLDAFIDGSGPQYAPPPTSPLERAIEAVFDGSDDSHPAAADLEAMDEDERKVVEKMMVMREGQQKFRSDLIAAYGGCAVTGIAVARALDAAHISDYMGLHTQDVCNGILMRTDLHRLFDAKLITVTPDFVLHVSPDLWGSPYQELAGRVITVPTAAAKQPNAALLEKHNAQCVWLAT